MLILGMRCSVSLNLILSDNHHRDTVPDLGIQLCETAKDL